MIRKNKFLFLLCSTFFLTTLLFLSLKKDEENFFFIRKEINSYGLYTHKGILLEEKKILNKPSVFFFGFLNCPDICPNTLVDISNIILKLGNQSNKINFYFVTVDPERDTISNMKEYLTNFNENIIGITGDVGNIKKFLKSMHVYYEKVFIDKEYYTLDHSSQMYIFEKNGKFFGTISLNESEKLVFEKIKSVI
ncbi:MAG: SCO family protein [Pseudomonadota bacterium]|nr:SCO family protein [Pseudomonadota bacterium]